MKFSILGPVEVVGEDGTLPLGGPRQRALLAFLLVNANRAVSADTLVEELWVTPPGDAHAALQNQISRLRKVVGDRLVTKAPGYLLRIEDGELDLDEFRSLVAAAGATTDAAERSRLLREADQLFRGVPFAEVDAPFAAAEAGALEELRLAAVEARVDADLERGRHAELVSELSSLVARHPLRERLRGQHILALYRCGRQAEALEAYRATRVALDEQLGLEPGPALRELERAILCHDPALAHKPLDEEPATVVVAPVVAGSRSRRRPLLLAAAAVALGIAGGAAALLLRQTPPAPEAVALPVAHHHRVVAPKTKPATHRAAHHVAHRATHAPAVVKHTQPRIVHERSVTVVTLVPTTTSAPVKPVTPAASPPPPVKHVTTTTQKQNQKQPANVTPTVTTQTVAAPPSSWKVLSDDFSSTTPNWAMWHSFEDGSGGSYVVANGRLELALDATAQPGGQYASMSQAFGTQCQFDGDFDARVDYTLLNWPTPTGAWVELSGWIPPNPGTNAGRTSSQYGDVYSGTVGSTWANYPTQDMHGTVRVARSGSTISTYYLHGSNWVLLKSGQAVGRVMLGLSVFAMGTDFQHKTVRAAFDNFRVAAPQVACP